MARGGGGRSAMLNIHVRVLKGFCILDGPGPGVHLLWGHSTKLHRLTKTEENQNGEESGEVWKRRSFSWVLSSCKRLNTKKLMRSMETRKSALAFPGKCTMHTQEYSSVFGSSLQGCHVTYDRWRLSGEHRLYVHVHVNTWKQSKPFT